MAHRYPPGPPAGLWGLALMRQFQRRPLELLVEWGARFGDIFSLPAGPYRLVFVNHPELIRQVLVADHKSFCKDPRIVKLLRQVDGNGLINSEGEFWLRQRRLMQPAFAATRLAVYSRTVVELANETFDGWRTGSVVDFEPAMTHLALRIIARVLFGVELTGQAAQLGRAVAVVSETIQREAGQVFVWPSWLPTPRNRRKRWALRTLDQLVRGIIRQRRQSAETPTDDLLARLLAATDSEGDGTGMSDEQLRDETMTLFNAGHDSTAAALVWIWIALAQAPDTQRRLAAEVADVVGSRLPTFADLPQLPFTQAVVYEALRLYPPTWLLMGRRVIAPVALAGYTLPRGTLVFISPWMTHRDARFYPQPTEFRPERFLGVPAPTLPQQAWIPFGAGPHICIGNTLALMEMSLITATLAQRHHLELAPGQGPVTPLPHVAIRPADGVRVLVSPKSPAT